MFVSLLKPQVLFPLDCLCRVRPRAIRANRAMEPILKALFGTEVPGTPGLAAPNLIIQEVAYGIVTEGVTYA